MSRLIYILFTFCIFLFSDYPFDYKIPDNAGVMYFKLNQGEINMAELHLWRKPVPASVGNKIVLEVSKVVKPARPGGLVRYTVSDQIFPIVF